MEPQKTAIYTKTLKASVMHRTQPHSLLYPILLFFFIVSGLLLIYNTHAGASEQIITGYYQESGGERLVLVLQVSSPPPATIIVTQRTPPGIEILAVTPPAKKNDSTSGEVKWLLTGVTPGPLLLQTTLATAPLNAGVSAEVRFRESKNGASQVVSITQ